MKNTINSIGDLQKYEKKIQPKDDKSEIFLCTGGGCIASGALEIKEALISALDTLGHNIKVTSTGCMGPCAGGPLIKIMPGSVIYENLTANEMEELVTTHFKEKKIYTKKVHHNIKDNKEAVQEADIDFFQ
ncbi:MAG: (2Fe-2S) ferredoxin domain-containing protein, partial [Spirochaetaceae bacterium]|nr:(2Fe-2S) ferredoxin domain-containing protein [Spirochaetaceae bacterium]